MLIKTRLLEMPGIVENFFEIILKNQAFRIGELIENPTENQLCSTRF